MATALTFGLAVGSASAGGLSAQSLVFGLSPQTATAGGTTAESLAYGLAPYSASAPPAGTLNVGAAITESLISAKAGGTLAFGGLHTESLISSKSSATLSFAALVTEILCSRIVARELVISALVRETLALAVPASQQSKAIFDDGFGPIPLFPALPEGYPVVLSPVMETTVGTMKSLREMRVAQQTYPTWDIEIPFEELLDQTQNQTPYEPFSGYHQYQDLVQTWLMMYGETGVFAFDCPWDNSRSNQFVAVGDGSSYTFDVYTTWGDGAQALALPVGLINQITAVYVGGTQVSPTTYAFSRSRLYFVSPTGAIAPPAAGAAVTMTFSYYYLCRFIADEQDFVEFAKNRWVVKGFKFRAAPWLRE